MRRSTPDLGSLAARFPGPAARRAAVALASLVEARRRFSALPALADIAAGVVTFSAAVEAARRVGAPLPCVDARKLDSAEMRKLDSAEMRALAEGLRELDSAEIADPAGLVLQEFRPAEHRKKHGAFFTRDVIAGELLDALEIPLDGARVLDPACGSGAFLRLAAERGARVSGADVDPEAVEVARFRVALEGGDVGEIAGVDLLADPSRMAGPFDAVVGNPPYVRFHALGENDRARLAARYETAHGQFDLFAPFLEAALARVAAGGRVAFVLPALLLRGARYADLRRFLLKRARVTCVIDHGDGAFEGVLAPTCVLVLRRTAEPAITGRATVRWVHAARRGSSRSTAKIEEGIWRRDPDAAFAPTSGAARDLIARLERLPTLASLADLGRGLEIGRGSDALSEGKGRRGLACLTGSDIARYETRPSRILDPAVLPARLAPLADDLAARVLVRETGARLTVARAEEGVASTRSLFHVRPHALPHHFVLGFLNGALAQWWYETRVRADSDIFPKLRIGQLGAFRVPTDPSLVEEVASLARAREELDPGSERSRREASRIEARIDVAIADALELDDAARALLIARPAAAAAAAAATSPRVSSLAATRRASARR